MSRALVSAGELIRILNEELAQYPESTACEFTMIDFKLPEPDQSGCNWNSAEVFMRNGKPVNIIRQLPTSIIAGIRKKYNLE